MRSLGKNLKDVGASLRSVVGSHGRGGLKGRGFWNVRIGRVGGRGKGRGLGSARECRCIAGMSAVGFELRVDPLGETTKKLFPTALQEGAEVLEGFPDRFSDFLTNFEKVLGDTAGFFGKSGGCGRFWSIISWFHAIIIT